jgi:hypothetical protein
MTNAQKPYVLHWIKCSTPQTIEIIELDEHPPFEQLALWVASGDPGPSYIERVQIVYGKCVPSDFDPPRTMSKLADRLTDMIVHEEGLIRNLPINWLATGLYCGSSVFQSTAAPICGDVIVFARGRLD